MYLASFGIELGRRGECNEHFDFDELQEHPSLQSKRLVTRYERS